METMLHTNFPHNYEIITNPELPGTGQWSVPEFYVPQDFMPKPNKGHLILKLEVNHKRQVWHVDAGETSEIWTTPDPDRILIDSIEGAIYVSAKDPQDTIKINLYGLRVTPAKEHGLLLLNDYFSLLALDVTGIRWQTPALFFDDMTIMTINDNKVVCSGLSLNSIDEEAKVVLDISTGRVLQNYEPQSSKQPFRGPLSWLQRKAKRGK
jgi:hypothetical protein